MKRRVHWAGGAHRHGRRVRHAGQRIGCAWQRGSLHVQPQQGGGRPHLAHVARLYITGLHHGRPLRGSGQRRERGATRRHREPGQGHRWRGGGRDAQAAQGRAAGRGHGLCEGDSEGRARSGHLHRGRRAAVRLQGCARRVHGVQAGAARNPPSLACVCVCVCVCVLFSLSDPRSVLLDHTPQPLLVGSCGATRSRCGVHESNDTAHQAVHTSVYLCFHLLSPPFF
jgi:hypothetical protein